MKNKENKIMYAVTVIDEVVGKVVIREVSKERLLDGLITFGGLEAYVGRRSPIVEWTEESYTPSLDDVTCNGRFGCE